MRLAAAFSFFLLASALKAQPGFFVQSRYPIDINGKRVEQPLTGGWNSPQFQSMDINQDGRPDMIVFDRTDAHLETWIRNSKGELIWDMRYASAFPSGHYFYKLADVNSDGKADVFTLSESGDLYIYLNRTGSADTVPRFEIRLNTYGEAGPQFYRNQYDSTFFILHNLLSFSNTDMPEVLDIDGDGDLDIVKYDPWNLTYTEFRDVRAEKGWSSDTFEFQVMDVCFGYFNEGFDNSIVLGECPYEKKYSPRHVGGSSCFFYDREGDGDMDMVISNVGFKRFTYLKNGWKDFQTEYDSMIAVDTLFPFASGEDFHQFAFPAGYLADADGDGQRDLLIAPNSAAEGKESHQVSYYRGTKNGQQQNWALQTHDFMGDARLDLGARSSPCALDVDSDGDMDLLVASNGDFEQTLGLADRLFLFENLGAPDYALKLKDDDYLGLSDSGWMQMVPASGDLDNDGDVDLLMGVGNGQVHWLSNKAGSGQPCAFVYGGLPLGAYAPAFNQTNAAPCLHDYNADGKTDVLVGYYDGRISAFAQGEAQSFVRESQHAWGVIANEWRTDTEPPSYMSFGYAVPRVADLDLDGSVELIVGTAQGRLQRYAIQGHSLQDTLLPDWNWIFQKELNGDSSVAEFGIRAIGEPMDLDGDSIPEVFIGSLRGGLNLVKSTQGRQVNALRPAIPSLDVQLWPNPNHGSFELNRVSAQQENTIRVYDATGRMVWTGHMAKGEKRCLVQLSGKEAGCYWLVVETEKADQRKTLPLIIQP